MLLLSRKRGEQVVIGNGITVTVLEVQGNRVRLGFNAPAKVSIRRQEIDTQEQPGGKASERHYRPIPMDPRRITEQAVKCLRASPYKAMRRVSCECKHGILVLKGRLFSMHEKQVAQKAVAGLRGVTQVVNEIAVG